MPLSSEITCPYCEKYLSDEKYDELYYSLEENGDETKIECENCGLFFRIEVEIEYNKSFYTYKIKDQPIKKEEIKDIEGQQFFNFDN